MSERGRDFSLSRFRAALAHFLVGRVAQAMAMLGFTFVAVRLLSVRDFAAYMLVFGLIEAGRPLVSLGLVPLLQQFLPEQALHGSERSLRRLTRYALFARSALTAALVAASYFAWPILLTWLGSSSNDAVPVALVCAVVAASLMADYSATVLETLMQQRLAQPLRATLPVGKLLALLLLWSGGFLSLEALLYAEFLLAMLTALVGEVLLARTITGLRPDGSRDADWRKMLRFAWHMSGAQLLATAANPGVVRMAAARVLDLNSLALFSFLQQLATYVTRFLPSTQLAGVLRPMLVARQVSGHSETVGAAVNFLWKLNVLVGVGILCVVWAGGADLAVLLYGQRVDMAWTALLLMLVLPVLVAQENLASTLLQLRRETELVRLLGLLSLAVPVTVLFGGRLGVQGAAAGLVVGIAAQSVVTLVVSCKDGSGARPDVMGFGRATLAAVVAGGIGSWVGSELLGQGSVSALTSSAIAALAYLLLLALARPVHCNEYELVRRVWPTGARPLRRFVWWPR